MQPVVAQVQLLQTDQAAERRRKSDQPIPIGPEATTDVKKRFAQIRWFRRQGYATELNESNEHAGCIAAPVVDASGRCIAALSLLVPEQSLVKPNREQLIVSVINAADRLSLRLG